MSDVASKAPAVQLMNISKRYGQQAVLADVSGQFESGIIHGIIGRNGSGKTMLFRAISGLIAIDKGEVWVFDQLIGKDADFPRDTGVVLSTMGFIPIYSGYKNLLTLAKMRMSNPAGPITQALEQVGLDPNDRKKVSKYSLGMRQKLLIAQAIMESPRLLLLDEPFNGLDKASVMQAQSLLVSMKEQGTTILLASHHENDIYKICDTVFEIEQGVMERIV